PPGCCCARSGSRSMCCRHTASPARTSRVWWRASKARSTRSLPATFDAGVGVVLPAAAPPAGDPPLFNPAAPRMVVPERIPHASSIFEQARDAGKMRKAGKEGERMAAGSKVSTQATIEKPKTGRVRASQTTPQTGAEYLDSLRDDRTIY